MKLDKGLNTSVYGEFRLSKKYLKKLLKGILAFIDIVVNYLLILLIVYNILKNNLEYIYIHVNLIVWLYTTSPN